MEIILYYMQLEDKYWGLFLVAVFVLWGMILNGACDRQMHLRWAFVAIFASLAYGVFICPLTYALVTVAIPELSSYYELSHIQQVVPLISLVLVLGWEEVRKQTKAKAAAFLAFVFLTLFLAGDFVYAPAYKAQMRVNQFDEECRQVYELLLAHGKERQDNSLRLWAMEDLMAQSRLYDSSFSPIYGKDIGIKGERYGEAQRELYSAYCAYDSDRTTPVTLKEQLDAIGNFPYLFPDVSCEYVVLYNPEGQFESYEEKAVVDIPTMIQNFSGLGYEFVGETEHYFLFYLTGR